MAMGRHPDERIVAASSDTLTNGDAGMGGVKLIAAQWRGRPHGIRSSAAPSSIMAFRVLPNNCAPNPEQEEFNVLANFFNGTLGVNGTATFPGLFTNAPLEATVNPPLTTSAPLNYLQVFDQDVIYAENNGCVLITNGAEGQTISVSAQDMLNAANQLLFTIGQKPYPPGAIPSMRPACSNSAPAPVYATMTSSPRKACETFLEKVPWDTLMADNES